MPDRELSSARLRPEAFKDLEVKVRGDSIDVEREIAKSRILEAAYASLANQPDFDPAAISISFKLKW